MNSSDPFKAAIQWGRRCSNRPDRPPAEIDVQDGRAEYVLSGPYRLGEGGKVEVVNGQLLFAGGSQRVT